jgi:hypothetical protein
MVTPWDQLKNVGVWSSICARRYLATSIWNQIMEDLLSYFEIEISSDNFIIGVVAW